MFAGMSIIAYHNVAYPRCLHRILACRAMYATRMIRACGVALRPGMRATLRWWLRVVAGWVGIPENQLLPALEGPAPAAPQPAPAPPQEQPDQQAELQLAPANPHQPVSAALEAQAFAQSGRRTASLPASEAGSAGADSAGVGEALPDPLTHAAGVLAAYLRAEERDAAALAGDGGSEQTAGAAAASGQPAASSNAAHGTGLWSTLSGRLVMVSPEQPQTAPSSLPQPPQRREAQGSAAAQAASPASQRATADSAAAALPPPVNARLFGQPAQPAAAAQRQLAAPQALRRVGRPAHGLGAGGLLEEDDARVVALECLLLLSLVRCP